MRFFIKNMSMRAVVYVMLGISASSVSLLGGNSLSSQNLEEPLIAPPEHAQNSTTSTSHASPQEMGTLDYYWTLGLIKIMRLCRHDREILLWALQQPQETRQAYIHVLLNGNPQRKELANTTNQDLSTPLHHVAKLGDAPTAHALLEADADQCARNNRHATPLHVAARYGAPPALIYLLLAGLESNKLRNYLEARDMLRKTALLLAAQYHHPVLVEQLIEAGANTQAVDKYQQNALHLTLDPGVDHGRGRRATRRPSLTADAAECVSILSPYLDIHALNTDKRSLWDMAKGNNAVRQEVNRLIDTRQVALQEVLADTIPHIPADLRDLIVKFEGSDRSVQVSTEPPQVSS